MIEFSCTYCGRKFKVADERSGKKGRCPNCKSTIIVPDGPIGELIGPPVTPEPVQSESKKSFKLTLLDVTSRAKEKESKPDQELPEGAYSEEMLAVLPGHVHHDPPRDSKRKRFFLIDIFFYPISKPGITILFIAAGIPFLLHFLTKVFAAITLIFTPMFVFLIMFHVFRVLAYLVLYPYIFWYLLECIRDSALGGLRAPETAGITPGLGELWWQTLRLLICITIAMLPAVIYIIGSRSFDTLFWSLYGLGVFLAPMAILAFVMFDSLGALSPFLIIGSALSTLFQYIGMLIFFYAIAALVPMAVYLLRKDWVMLHCAEFVAFYLVLISAHLIGRFYWKYQDKLNWEV